MSKRRSQRNITTTTNLNPETNQMDVIIQVEKCANCSKIYETWFEEQCFNIHKKCPCILSVCMECSDESFKDDSEYCPLDKHESVLNFVEKECPGVSKETKPLNFTEIAEKINFIVNEHKIILRYEENLLDNIDGAEGDNIIHTSLINDTLETSNQTVTNGHHISDTQNNLKNTKSNILFIILGIIIVCIAIFFSWYRLSNNSVEISNKTVITFEEVVERLNTLEKTYSKQPGDLWASLRVGMRKLVNHINSPTTILLLHSQNSKVNTCLLAKIKDITIDIASFQKNEVEFKQKGKGVYINMEDYPLVFDNAGEFMEKYKSELEQDKLLIVENFHKSPMTVMEAFHYLSDTIDPWVKNVLIILTLEIKISKRVSQHIEDTAEQELRELLKSLPDNLSNPLITRLTENVFMVADEAKDSSCSLSS